MIEYISSDELAVLIKSNKVSRKDYLIVDVRDDDWVGGNIKGSFNSPSHRFLFDVGRLVRDTKHVPLLVFHCTMSQVRGPKAARIYTEQRAKVSEVPGDAPPRIVVLRDGFSQFQVKFRNDPALIENWDPQVWAENWH